MIGYYGGLEATDRRTPALGWRATSGDHDLFLETSGEVGAYHQNADLVVLVRGRCRFHSAPNTDNLATALAQHYRLHGDLPMESLVGGFTVVLQDARQGKTLLYRNLMGAGFTYYAPTAGGFCFGSNLAELVERRGSAAANQEVLPAYFLFRFVPGRDTLFRDCHRLLPGEEVVLDHHGIRRRQRQTFADLRNAGGAGSADVEQVESVLADILHDQMASQPNTANLLSGGIDSTYLQARWGALRGGPTRSFSVTVNHPRSQPDTEYALTAAQALGAHHTLVAADGPYVDYLRDLLSATGEPPNHAFSVYLGLLARRMTAAGLPMALCGEGADSLFGMGNADVVRHALWIRRVAPLAWLRGPLGRLADRLGHDNLAAAFRLAGHVHDPRHRKHPLNRVAVFADWELVESTFGADRLDHALANRRALLDQYDVDERPLERLHAIGYLGEAVDSASLWTTLFNHAGGDLCCPFLDSRLLQLALNLPASVRFAYRRPKKLLKDALARYVPRAIVERSKLGFGQPIFEWLSPGGQLRPWAERIGQYEWLTPATRNAALARPGWFLYSLLCYDLWHQRFIDRTTIDLPATATRSTSHALSGVAREASS